MNKVYALTDYNNHFGSKHNAFPYRSGFDKSLLEQYFSQSGYTIKFLKFKDVDFQNTNWKNRIVLYTSSEEIGYNYKSYIEDIILGLEHHGAFLIPGFHFLRANNNKVFMEVLRGKFNKNINSLQSKVYGTIEELSDDIKNNSIAFPCVIKKSEGAMSKGVYLSKNKKSLLISAKKISRSPHYLHEIKDFMRKFIHKDYKPESKYQNKFIIQPFIKDLTNDWKILIFGDHYYILNRGIKENDFRASGSRYNYKVGLEANFPLQLLDYINKFFIELKVPNLSVDFVFDGENGYVIEFQAINFGLTTMEINSIYFAKKNGKWQSQKKQSNQEEEYVYSIVNFLENSNFNQKKNQ